MKKILSTLFALLLVICGVTLTTAVVNAAPVVPTGGSGTQSDPYLITLADYGEYEYSATAEGIYYSITFAKDGIVTFGGGGYAYKGSGNQSFSDNEDVTANTPVIVRKAASRNLTISYNAKSSYTTKDTAYDLTAITTVQSVSIPQGAKAERDTWFKFSITAPSTIEFEPYDDNTNSFYGFFKEDGTTQALTAKNFFDADEFSSKLTNNGTFSLTTLDENIFIPTNTYKGSYSTDHVIKDNKVKLSFYEAGTYYILCNGSASADRGFKSFILRPYNPITGVTLSQGASIDVVEGQKGTNVTNYILGIEPADADGFPVAIDYDKTKLEVTSTTIGGSDGMSGVDLTGAFGKFTVDFLNEMGTKIGGYTINNVPKAVVDIHGTGTQNSAAIHLGSGNSTSSADSVRIYLKDGSSYKLYNTYKLGESSVDKSMVIKKLKAGKKYKIKLTNYDSQSGAESAMSKEFTIGTAPGKKPVIKSVKNIKITKQTGTLTHNPGKINEYRTHYTYYAASGKITVGKVKGAKMYEYNLYGTGCPNSTSKTSDILRLIKGGSTAGSCKKTIKLRCRTYVKINNYFEAYGAWGKVKKVKIK